MKVVVQRVKHASVTIDGRVNGKINNGFLVLLGVSSTDTKQDVDYLVKKVTNLRIFTDEKDKMNLSFLWYFLFLSFVTVFFGKFI